MDRSEPRCRPFLPARWFWSCRTGSGPRWATATPISDGRWPSGGVGRSLSTSSPHNSTSNVAPSPTTAPVSRSGCRSAMADVELGLFRAGLEQLGKGGLGTAYRVKYFRLPNAPFELVYKEYKDRIEVRNELVLRDLIDVRSAMPAADRAVIDRSTSWPLALVRDEGRTT